VEHLGWTREQIEERLAGIGGTLGEIYAKAEAKAITTEAAAEQLAAARLHKAARPSTTRSALAT
jgi:glutamate dehydrogenase/leucine dehydrogenase